MMKRTYSWFDVNQFILAKIGQAPSASIIQQSAKMSLFSSIGGGDGGHHHRRTIVYHRHKQFFPTTTIITVPKASVSILFTFASFTLCHFGLTVFLLLPCLVDHLTALGHFPQTKSFSAFPLLTPLESIVTLVDTVNYRPALVAGNDNLSVSAVNKNNDGNSISSPFASSSPPSQSPSSPSSLPSSLLLSSVTALQKAPESTVRPPTTIVWLNSAVNSANQIPSGLPMEPPAEASVAAKSPFTLGGSSSHYHMTRLTIERGNNNNHYREGSFHRNSLFLLTTTTPTPTTIAPEATAEEVAVAMATIKSPLLTAIASEVVVDTSFLVNFTNNYQDFKTVIPLPPPISSVHFDQSVKTRRSVSLVRNPIATNINVLPVTTPVNPTGQTTKSEEQRTFITGLEGSRSALPCNVTRPLNDSIDLILWFRGADEKALYSIDARRAPTMQRAKHFSGDELGARAYIDISTSPTRLIIESVKAEDAGEYKCRIDFRKSRSEYRSVQLDVYVPPKEVIIMDEFGQRLADPVGPFNEGAHLNLFCEAEGGNPRPILHWYLNNRLVDDSWTVTAQGIVRNELVLSRLERSDQGSVLTCQVLLNITATSSSSSSTTTSLSGGSITANNNTNTITSSQLPSSSLPSSTSTSSSLLTLKNIFSAITLELNLRPLDVRITTVHRPVIAGQMVTINCESSGSKPAALISWWKGAKRLENAVEDVTTNSEDENRTLSALQLIPNVEDNGQVLTCRADHSVLPDSALEDSWILNVFFAPKLTISFGASIQHDQIREGSNVSFECHVAANPSVNEIGWMYESRLLTLGKTDFSAHSDHLHGDGHIQVAGNTLIIYSVHRRHSGRYRCVAANAQGEGQSEDILLKVQYTPVCKQDQRTLYGVAKKEPIQVPCTVEADPAEGLRFRWAFNNTFDMVAVKSFMQPTTTASMTSVATYAPLNKYSYGQLLCWATNKLGEQSEPCIFNVVPAGQPQPLRNCVVRNQSTDGLVVYCDPGDDGGLEQEFFLEVFQAEHGQLVSNASLNKPPVEFVVTDVPVSTTFVLVLYAANAKGRSNYVTLSASTTPLDSRGSEFLKFTSDFGIKPVIYILGVVVTSLVLCAIIIMLVSKFRSINKSRGRHEPLPNLQSKSKLSVCSNNGENRTHRHDSLHDGNNGGDSGSGDVGNHVESIGDCGYIGEGDELPMFNLGPSSIPGVPGGTSAGAVGSIDLYENQEILTNSSSLYDESVNLPMNSVYKTYAQSLLADVSTATPNSPSQNQMIGNGSGGAGGNVIIKNSMAHHLEQQSSSSIESGVAPPLYHSVYNNFATATTVGHHTPVDDLLLMDVAGYYGGASAASNSPSHAHLLGNGGTISMPYHHHAHHHQGTQFSGPPSDMLNAVLMATSHLSSPTSACPPYLSGAGTPSGTVSLVDTNSGQARFFAASPVSNRNENIIFEPTGGSGGDGRHVETLANGGIMSNGVSYNETLHSNSGSILNNEQDTSKLLASQETIHSTQV